MCELASFNQLIATTDSQPVAQNATRQGIQLGSGSNSNYSFITALSQLVHSCHVRSAEADTLQAFRYVYERSRSVLARHRGVSKSGQSLTGKTVAQPAAQHNMGQAGNPFDVIANQIREKDRKIAELKAALDERDTIDNGPNGLRRDLEILKKRDAEMITASSINVDKITHLEAKTYRQAERIRVLEAALAAEKERSRKLDEEKEVVSCPLYISLADFITILTPLLAQGRW